jgi:hypothetical protein
MYYTNYINSYNNKINSVTFVCTNLRQFKSIYYIHIVDIIYI